MHKTQETNYYTKSANVSAGSTDITGIVTSGMLKLEIELRTQLHSQELPNPIVGSIGIGIIVSYGADGNVFGDDFQFSVLRETFYFGDPTTTNGSSCNK